MSDDIVSKEAGEGGVQGGFKSTHTMQKQVTIPKFCLCKHLVAPMNVDRRY